MSLAYLDIEDKRIKSFEELKQLFDSQDAKNSGSRLYQLLIDMAVDFVLADFLDNVGKKEMAEQTRALDHQQTDLQIMNELQRIISGDTVDINLNPLEYVKVLGTSISQCEYTVQTCFEIQILKIAKEELLFSVVSETDRCEKHLNLENYRCGEIVKLTQELPITGKISFRINDKEVQQRFLNFEVTFQCDVQGVSLYVDEQLLATSFPARLSLLYGKHDIRALKRGYLDYEKRILAEDSFEYSIRLKKAPVSVGDILCTDDTTVPCSEWPVEGKTAKGVVFYVDDSSYHGWAVHLKDQGSFVWETGESLRLVPGLSECNSEKLALADMNGYNNTRIIRSPATTTSTSTTTSSSKGDSPGSTSLSTTVLVGALAALIATATVISKSSSLSGKPTDPTCCYPAASAVDFANGWFLPACGQLKTLIDRKNKVNDSLKKAGGDIVSNSEYWSSTQKSKDHVCSVYGNGNVYFHNKDFYCKVRAIRTF